MITYKDISLLAEQTSISGTQKIPVTKDMYVTFNRIKSWIESTLSVDYGSVSNTPAIYKANHNFVPTANFDSLWNYENDIWLCNSTMYNSPADDNGDINNNWVSNFENCIIQQLGFKDSATKVQILYVTTGDVTSLTQGGIFYRLQTDGKWFRLATSTDTTNIYQIISNINTTLNSLTTNKQDKLSIKTPDIYIASNGAVTISPTANNVQFINLSGSIYRHTINLNYLNSLDEYTLIITNPNKAGRITINANSSYKYVGVIPSWSYNSWVLTIWRGLIFSNILN